MEEVSLAWTDALLPNGLTASATNYLGIKASISGSTLTCETLGFTSGGGRSAFISGNIKYFR